MKLWYVEGEQDVPCMVTYVYELVLLPDGTVRQIYFYCVDVSEFVVNKLADRGSLSARGIVTNVQDFVVNLQKGLGL